MVITEEMYNDLSARIDAGEFLGKYHANAKDETPELPPLPAAAPEDLKTYRDKCQHILDFYEQKIKTKEAQIENMRHALEGSKAQSQAYDETVKLNGMLEKTIEEQKDELSKKDVEYMVLDSERNELQRKNTELEEKCSKQQKENEALDCQNEEMRNSLNTLEEECDQLRKQVRSKMQAAGTEAAPSDTFMQIMERSIAYTCDTGQIKEDLTAYAIGDLLTHILDTTELQIPHKTREELKSNIMKIGAKRKEQRREANAANVMSIHIGQLNNGDGLMTNDKALIPDDIRKMANKTAGL